MKKYFNNQILASIVDGKVFHAVMIPLQKIIKYVFLEICILVLELLFKSIGILNVFSEDVQYITLNMSIGLIGIAIIMALLYLFITRRHENSFRKTFSHSFISIRYC